MAACSAVAVVLHVPLNFFLVFVLSLGVPGVAIASALTNFNMLMFLLIYLWWTGTCKLTWCGWASPATVASGVTPLVKLAVPSCLSVCLEWWWYEIMTVLAGYLPDPTTAVGAAAVLIQTTSLMYTVPMALAACVSTRVSSINYYKYSRTFNNYRTTHCWWGRFSTSREFLRWSLNLINCTLLYHIMFCYFMSHKLLVVILKSTLLVLNIFTLMRAGCVFL